MLELTQHTPIGIAYKGSKMNTTEPEVKVLNHPVEPYLFKVTIDYGSHTDDVSGWVDQSQLNNLIELGNIFINNERFKEDKPKPGAMSSHSFNFANEITRESFLLVLPELSILDSKKAREIILNEVENSLVRAGWKRSHVKRKDNDYGQPMRGWKIGKALPQKCVVFRCRHSKRKHPPKPPHTLSSPSITQHSCTEIVVSHLAWPYLMEAMKELSKRVLSL